MIKFFRKIRHNLLSEGKTRKYFKYAFGEILLVMIGILLALQVNNWNQQRKDRNQEQFIIERLKNDLASDIELISYQMEKSEIVFGFTSNFDKLYFEKSLSEKPPVLYLKRS